MAETLFDKYGGFETFTQVVTKFYQKILDNEQVEHYFSNTNMDSLIAHQTNFLAKVLGGPYKYEGRHLKTVHAPFNITAAVFSEVADLLEEALDEGGVEEADIAIILSAVSGLQDKIVSS